MYLQCLGTFSKYFLNETFSDGSKESIEDKLAANRKLKNLRNTRLQLVNKAYKKQSVNQISLKVGKYTCTVSLSVFNVRGKGQGQKGQMCCVTLNSHLIMSPRGKFG